MRAELKDHAIYTCVIGIGGDTTGDGVTLKETTVEKMLVMVAVAAAKGNDG